MDAPFTVIDKVLKAAENGKEADFLRYVAENANIEFNGTTFSGKDFGKAFVSLGCRRFSIEYLEVFDCESNPDHATFFVRTTVPGNDDQNLSGRYHIEMSWVDKDDNCVINNAIIQKAN